ncbi:MAG: hypothetical protein Kow0063_22770 [Anaerolineae bacterium]
MDLQEQKSYAAAVEVYEQIAALEPQAAEPFLAMGHIYLTQGRWPLAEDAFNRALSRDAESAEAWAGLATARWERGDRLHAVSLWESALARWSDDPKRDRADTDLSDIRLRLALAYLDTDQPAKAENLFHQEVEDFDTPVAHLYLAMMQATGRPAGARRELEAIGEDAPAPVVAARDYFLEALARAEAAATAAGAAKVMGLAFVQAGEWQLAHAALDQALALDPTDAEARAFLGHTRSQLGRPAFAYLARAVEEQPDWALGHYMLGLYYFKQEVYDLAEEELQTTLRLDPGNAQALADLARIYVQKGQYFAAEEALAQAVASEPDDPAFHSALVHFYAGHAFQISQKGLPAAQAAIALTPQDPQAYDMLGWMYLLAGDPQQAQVHLESALSLDPELASAHYHLGILRKVMGQEEAARYALMRAIDLDTDGFYREQAQKALSEIARARE